MVNQAPVLTLWAVVVPGVLGFGHDEGLTLGRAVARVNAYSKGVSLGFFQPTPKEVEKYGLNSNQGVIITWVDPKGPLGEAGFEAEDIILQIDSLPLTLEGKLEGG